MKKLVFKEGSITPFWMKDLEYLQDGVEEAIGAIARGLSLGTENFVITGCKITYNGTKISMTSGWCYYEGEILPVAELPPMSCSESSPKIKFSRVDGYDSEGDRQISLSGSSGMFQVYENRYLEPSIVNDGDSYTLAISEGAWDLGERIANWGKITDTTRQLKLNAYSGNISYRMIGGVVQLLGYVWNDAVGGGISGTITNGLPHPSMDLVLNTASGKIQISSNGILSITSPDDRVYVNHIVYLSSPSFASNDGHYSTLNQNNGGITS